MHINIKSLLPKIDELRYIIKLSEVAVTGISESKLDDSVLSSAIKIKNCDLIRSDRNRHGGGIACFIKSFLLSEIETVFIETFLAHSKPNIVGSTYRPPSQSSFTEIITEHFSKIDINDTEIYILGGFNIDLFSNQKYISSKEY